MEKGSLTLTGNGVEIQGRYYTVSNGFTSKKEGPVSIPYGKILAVDYVKRRSKRIMYIILVFGLLLIFALSAVRARVERAIESLDFSSVASSYETVRNISDAIDETETGNFYEILKAIVTGVTILAAAICVFCIIYLFTAKKCVEITSMQGTYRVVAEPGSTELARVVPQLQERIARQ